MLWRIALWLAERGWFRYEGLIGYEPRWWPRGHVVYPDGSQTYTMALGNAVNYQRLFGGTVERSRT